MFTADDGGDESKWIYKIAGFPRNATLKKHARLLKVWKAAKHTARKATKLKHKRRAGSVASTTVKKLFMASQGSKCEEEEE